MERCRGQWKIPLENLYGKEVFENQNIIDRIKTVIEHLERYSIENKIKIMEKKTNTHTPYHLPEVGKTIENTRTIKFRGFQPERKKWVFGDLIHVNAGGTFIFSYTDGFEDRIVVDPKTVGQFTGLFSADRDFLEYPNKEAYFGDIIRFYNTEGHEFVKELSFSNELGCIMVGNKTYQRLYESGYIQPSKLEFEIIGNIHQNPELLK